ncbi:MAG: hypothetical protein RR936_12815 [Carnobacterium sp.]|uniref:hypothetical protein n=1 Tax=Carnobacterium sp. TaxID=48221 RepID=UPI002FC9E320
MNDYSIYALVDEDMRIVRHKGKLAIFTDHSMLKKHMWRYMWKKKKYKIVELLIDQIIEEVERE